ncbi:MAG TPA: PQQ-binding-like beta-propeller repeat protein, partial [Pirellulales bacterium]
MKIIRYRLPVASVAALSALAYFVTVIVARAADQSAAGSAAAPVNAVAASSAVGSSGGAGGTLNLGKQAEQAKGELAGVEGYTQYAAEVVGVGPNDWSMWGGSSIRNNTPEAKNIPAQWTPGEFDADTGAWKNKGAQNIKWVAPLGFKSYGNPVVANGHIYVGTNNGHAYLKRYPADVDLGVLLCFDEKTGDFLWQDSNEKLPTGRVNDWPDEGVCSAPLVQDSRLWYVSNRGELRCLSTDGLRGGKNIGPVTNEKEMALKKNPKAEWEADKEPDVIWVLDMMKQLGVQQHNMSNCSVIAAGDVLFVNTSNGVDEAHINLPAPYAPTFIAVDKSTGQVLWTDNSPGPNVLHGQWSSPAYAVIDGQPQAILGCGDGWVYSFDPRTAGGEPKLLWKFDCNPRK